MLGWQVDGPPQRRVGVSFFRLPLQLLFQLGESETEQRRSAKNGAAKVLRFPRDEEEMVYLIWAIVVVETI